MRQMASRERSRSPRRSWTKGAGGAGTSSLPIADLLLQLKVLDETSVDFLKKAPVDIAGQILLDIGPALRNPSAFVTKRLRELNALGLATGRHSSSGHASARSPVASASDASANDCVNSTHEAFPSDWAEGEEIQYHHNGELFQMTWVSKEQAADHLQQIGVLDQMSSDYLAKVPESEAKRVIQSLGPDVRNTSAIVTRMLREAQQQSFSPMNAGDGGAVEATGGALQQLNAPAIAGTGPIAEILSAWQSKEWAAEELVQAGVLDQGSADFLLKATDWDAKEMIASLGPDVRNPSAVVTKMMKSYVAQHGAAGGPSQSQSRGKHSVSKPAVDVITIYHNGQPLQIEFGDLEETVQGLRDSDILDQTSADFLLKVTWEEAKDCLLGLGPDVRNPSAFVTKTLNRIVRDRSSGAPGYYETKQRPSWQTSKAQTGLQWYKPQASYAAVSEVLMVYQNGQPLELTWVSKEQAVQDLLDCGLLDQGSGAFLMKANEKDAKEIVRLLGPDVRNPSAMVTNKMKAIRNLLA